MADPKPNDKKTPVQVTVPMEARTLYIIEDKSGKGAPQKRYMWTKDETYTANGDNVLRPMSYRGRNNDKFHTMKADEKDVTYGENVILVVPKDHPGLTLVMPSRLEDDSPKVNHFNLRNEASKPVLVFNVFTRHPSEQERKKKPPEVDPKRNTIHVEKGKANVMSFGADYGFGFESVIGSGPAVYSTSAEEQKKRTTSVHAMTRVAPFKTPYDEKQEAPKEKKFNAAGIFLLAPTPGKTPGSMVVVQDKIPIVSTGAEGEIILDANTATKFPGIKLTGSDPAAASESFALQREEYVSGEKNAKSFSVPHLINQNKKETNLNKVTFEKLNVYSHDFTKEQLEKMKPGAALPLAKPTIKGVYDLKKDADDKKQGAIPPGVLNQAKEAVPSAITLVGGSDFNPVLKTTTGKSNKQTL